MAEPLQPGRAQGSCALRRAGAAACVLASLVLAGPRALAQEVSLEQLRVRALTQSITGVWGATAGEAEIRLDLGVDGQFSLDGAQGVYSLRRGRIELETEDAVATYSVQLLAGHLVLSEGDLTEPLTFSRAVPPDESQPVRPAPSTAPPAGALGVGQSLAAAETLAGRWLASVGKVQLDLILNDNGQCVFNGRRGTYAVSGNALALTYPEGDIRYQFDVSVPDTLALSGGDLSQPLKFTRGLAIGDYVRRLFRVSVPSAKQKGVRILSIMVIVVASRLLIAGLRWLSRFVIYCEWGPLHSVYRRHKSRVMTIHSIVLNLLKYVVYFTALGFVLTELGVNYTTYLASLSVIGLAIGFGSQGLVQDLVTGFFIVFERQFDVGDMVEISGQTGIVEEFGLRMTRLKNYLGQSVTIPNRNIALVGNFSKGALEAQVDVAVSDPAAAGRAVPLVRKAAREIGRQFEGVVVVGPKVEKVLGLATGESFVRLYVAIWPQQQWFVDQQLVPRLREILKRDGFDVPGDRVVAFYHVPGHEMPRKGDEER